MVRFPASLLDDDAATSLLRRIIVAGPIEQLHQDFVESSVTGQMAAMKFFFFRSTRKDGVIVFNFLKKNVLEEN